MAFEEEPVGTQPGGPVVGDPVVEHFFELWVQWDVAVVVKFADRYAQPERGTDLNHCVNGEAEQFALADPGAGEEFNDEARQGVGIGS